MKPSFFKFITFAFVITASISSHAFYTFQDTGDLLAPGRYALGGELQMVTSGDSGVNAVGKFDGGINDSLNYRAVVGFGNVNYQMQALIKWVPIPDVDSQPAIGLTTGLLYANYDIEGSNGDDNEFSVRFIPFLSKKFDSAVGPFTPYVAAPLAIRTFDGDSDVPVSLAIGTKYSHIDLKGVEFTAEAGFNVDDAYNYISIGAIFPFDDNMKFEASKN